MPRVFSLPHLSTGAAMTSEWLLESRGELLPLPAVLKGWDYQTPLRLQCTVTADPVAVIRDCGLGPDARISVVAMWWASSTNRRVMAASVPLADGAEVLLDFEIPPGAAGGTLTLSRLLVLTRPSAAGARLAASTAGAVLWREPRERQTRTILEGDSARFPTEVIDFGGRIGEPDGVWWLEHDFSDLDTTPLAALRLYLNGAHPAVGKLLAGDRAGEILQQMINWDVARAMVHAALDSEDFHRRWGSFRPGCLGETVELLIRRIWTGEDAVSLAALRSTDRGGFEARLQGRLQLLGLPQ